MIVTDGIYTLYAFSYECGDIQWSGQGFETAIVGYNSLGDYFYNHPANVFSDIGRIVLCTRWVTSQGSRRKQQADQQGPVNLAPGNPTMRMAIQECLNLAKSDIVDINGIMDVNGNIVNIADMLPQCPRTESEANLDLRFQPFSDRSGCFRSSQAFVPEDLTSQLTLEFVSLCCYNSG